MPTLPTLDLPISYVARGIVSLKATAMDSDTSWRDQSIQQARGLRMACNAAFQEIGCKKETAFQPDFGDISLGTLAEILDTGLGVMLGNSDSVYQVANTLKRSEDRHECDREGLKKSILHWASMTGTPSPASGNPDTMWMLDLIASTSFESNFHFPYFIGLVDLSRFSMNDVVQQYLITQTIELITTTVEAEGKTYRELWSSREHGTTHVFNILKRVVEQYKPDEIDFAHMLLTKSLRSYEVNGN